MKKDALSIGGFQQNCYKIGTSGSPFVATVETPKKIYVLERQQVGNGFQDVLVEKDYPITSESVTSYADGADYRNDPAQAIANAPTRVNLGDITEAQDFLSNPQNFMRVYKETVAKLNQYQAEQNKIKSSPAEEETEQGENKQ